MMEKAILVVRQQEVQKMIRRFGSDDWNLRNICPICG